MHWYAIVPLLESEFSMFDLPIVFGNFRNLKAAWQGNTLTSEMEKYTYPGMYLSKGCRAELNKSL